MSKMTLSSPLSKDAYLLGVLNDNAVLLSNAYKENGEIIYKQAAIQAELAQALLKKDLAQRTYRTSQR